MSDVKIIACFVLPGRTLPAEPPLLKNWKKKKRKEKEKNREDILYRQETIYPEKGKLIVISVRIGKPSRQSLHLSLEAYNHMTSEDNPVQGIKIFEWKKLSKNKRVKLHLQTIGESLGGKLESFTILED